MATVGKLKKNIKSAVKAYKNARNRADGLAALKKALRSVCREVYDAAGNKIEDVEGSRAPETMKILSGLHEALNNNDDEKLRILLDKHKTEIGMQDVIDPALLDSIYKTQPVVLDTKDEMFQPQKKIKVTPEDRDIFFNEKFRASVGEAVSDAVRTSVTKEKEKVSENIQFIADQKTFNAIRSAWIAEINQIIKNDPSCSVKQASLIQSYEEREKLFEHYSNTKISNTQKLILAVHMFAGGSMDNIEEYLQMIGKLPELLDIAGFSRGEIDSFVAALSLHKGDIETYHDIGRNIMGEIFSENNLKDFKEWVSDAGREAGIVMPNTIQSIYNEVKEEKNEVNWKAIQKNELYNSSWTDTVVFNTLFHRDARTKAIRNVMDFCVADKQTGFNLEKALVWMAAGEGTGLIEHKKNQALLGQVFQIVKYGEAKSFLKSVEKIKKDLHDPIAEKILDGFASQLSAEMIARQVKEFKLDKSASSTEIKAIIAALQAIEAKGDKVGSAAAMKELKDEFDKLSVDQPLLQHLEDGKGIDVIQAAVDDKLIEFGNLLQKQLEREEKQRRDKWVEQIEAKKTELQQNTDPKLLQALMFAENEEKLTSYQNEKESILEKAQIIVLDVKDIDSENVANEGDDAVKETLNKLDKYQIILKDLSVKLQEVEQQESVRVAHILVGLKKRVEQATVSVKAAVKDIKNVEMQKDGNTLLQSLSGVTNEISNADPKTVTDKEIENWDSKLNEAERFLDSAKQALAQESKWAEQIHEKKRAITEDSDSGKEFAQLAVVELSETKGEKNEKYINARNKIIEKGKRILTDDVGGVVASAKDKDEFDSKMQALNGYQEALDEQLRQLNALELQAKAESIFEYVRGKISEVGSSDNTALVALASKYPENVNVLDEQKAGDVKGLLHEGQMAAEFTEGAENRKAGIDALNLQQEKDLASLARKKQYLLELKLRTGELQQSVQGLVGDLTNTVMIKKGHGVLDDLAAIKTGIAEVSLTTVTIAKIEEWKSKLKEAEEFLTAAQQEIEAQQKRDQASHEAAAAIARKVSEYVPEEKMTDPQIQGVITDLKSIEILGQDEGVARQLRDQKQDQFASVGVNKNLLQNLQDNEPVGEIQAAVSNKIKELSVIFVVNRNRDEERDRRDNLSAPRKASREAAAKIAQTVRDYKFDDAKPSSEQIQSVIVALEDIQKVCSGVDAARKMKEENVGQFSRVGVEQALLDRLLPSDNVMQIQEAVEFQLGKLRSMLIAQLARQEQSRQDDSARDKLRKVVEHGKQVEQKIISIEKEILELNNQANALGNEYKVDGITPEQIQTALTEVKGVVDLAQAELDRKPPARPDAANVKVWHEKLDEVSNRLSQALIDYQKAVATKQQEKRVLDLNALMERTMHIQSEVITVLNQLKPCDLYTEGKLHLDKLTDLSSKITLAQNNLESVKDEDITDWTKFLDQVEKEYLPNAKKGIEGQKMQDLLDIIEVKAWKLLDDLTIEEKRYPDISKYAGKLGLVIPQKVDHALIQTVQTKAHVSSDEKNSPIITFNRSNDDKPDSLRPLLQTSIENVDQFKNALDVIAKKIDDEAELRVSRLQNIENTAKNTLVQIGDAEKRYSSMIVAANKYNLNMPIKPNAQLLLDIHEAAMLTEDEKSENCKVLDRDEWHQPDILEYALKARTDELKRFSKQLDDLEKKIQLMEDKQVILTAVQSSQNIEHLEALIAGRENMGGFSDAVRLLPVDAVSVPDLRVHDLYNSEPDRNEIVDEAAKRVLELKQIKFIDHVKSQIDEVKSVDDVKFSVLNYFLGEDDRWDWQRVKDEDSTWVKKSLSSGGNAHTWAEYAPGGDEVCQSLTEDQEKIIWDHAEKRRASLLIEKNSVLTASKLYYLPHDNNFINTLGADLKSPPLEKLLVDKIQEHLNDEGVFKQGDNSFYQIKQILAEYLISKKFEPEDSKFEEYKQPTPDARQIRDIIKKLEEYAKDAPLEAKEILKAYLERFEVMARDPKGMSGISQADFDKDLLILQSRMREMIEKAHYADAAVGNGERIKKSLDLYLHFPRLAAEVKEGLKKLQKVPNLIRSFDEYKPETIDSRQLQTWLTEAGKYAEKGSKEAQISLGKWEDMDRLLSGAGADKVKIYPPMEAIKQGDFNPAEPVYWESTAGDYAAQYIRLSDVPARVNERFGREILTDIYSQYPDLHDDKGNKKLVDGMMDHMPDAIRILENALRSRANDDPANPKPRIPITDVKRPEVALALQVLIESKGLQGKVDLTDDAIAKHEQNGFLIRDISSVVSSLDSVKGIKFTREKELDYLKGDPVEDKIAARFQGK